MTGELGDIAEGLADAGTGAAFARAAEPAAGEGAGHTHEGACLNCGTALVGSHCHACGQRAHVHRTLAAFFHDLLHGVLHFEGKTWRTIPLLVWKPGRLTREYIDGKRASYVSPIALFLFVVFLSFALFNALGGATGQTRIDGPRGDRNRDGRARQGDRECGGEPHRCERRRTRSRSTASLRSCAATARASAS